MFPHFHTPVNNGMLWGTLPLVRTTIRELKERHHLNLFVFLDVYVSSLHKRTHEMNPYKKAHVHSIPDGDFDLTEF